jgi:hypothetical protein
MIIEEISKPQRQKTLLTLTAQQYGLTVEDLMAECGCERGDIIVEQVKQNDKQERTTN